MPPRFSALVIWIPRVAGIAVTLFAALFALDAFDGRSLVKVLPDFLIHLIPAVLVALAVAIAWRFPWVGAVAFSGLAISYALMARNRPDWILVISGPLAVTAALFALGAMLDELESPGPRAAH
jgi:hypothetical protein